MGEYSRSQRSINETSRKGYRGNNNGKSSTGGTQGRRNSCGGNNCSIESSHINASKRSDSRSVLFTHGLKHDVHPSYYFSSDVWITIPQEERYRLTE